jgi:hypothetical protein
VLSGGSYGRSLAFFTALADAAKKDFPHLTDADIQRFTVTKSSYNQGFAGVRFSLPSNTEHPDYRLEQLDFYHC